MRYAGVPELVVPVQVEEGLWRAEGPEAGATVAIFGGVHGEETAGPEVVSRSVKNGVQMIRGVLYLAHANLGAMQLGIHQLGDENMNRMFLNQQKSEPPHEAEKLSATAKRVETLKPYMDASEALLDLHEAHSGRIEPFIICEPNAFATAQKIGAKVISFGWSKTEPGGTDGYMYEQGKEGLCYELGFIDDFVENAARGEAAVARFLSAKGLTAESLEPLYSNQQTRYIRTLQAFVRDTPEPVRFASRDYWTFDRLPAHVPIAWHGNRVIMTDRDDVVALFPNHDAKPDQEFLSFGEEISFEDAMVLQAAA